MKAIGTVLVVLLAVGGLVDACGVGGDTRSECQRAYEDKYIDRGTIYDPGLDAYCERTGLPN